jgi:hypothetical protein
LIISVELTHDSNKELSQCYKIIEKHPVYAVKLILPYKGIYNLTIFGRSETNPGKDLFTIIQYKIVAKYGAGEKSCFPLMHLLGEKYELTSSSHENGIINTKKGKETIKLSSNCQLELNAIIKSNKQELQGCTRVRNSKSCAYEIEFITPSAGRYEIEIYGNP